MLNLALAKILVFALCLSPVNSGQIVMHVMEGGKYSGTYTAERTSPEHVVFKKTPEDSKLIPLEAERSRRYEQYYTVFVTKTGESASINLTNPLKDLKSFKDKPSQKLSDKETQLTLDLAGSILIMASEADKTIVILEKPAVQ
jgi:hypothetical protein